MITVVRDADGDAWVRIGPDMWAMTGEIQKGKKYAEAWAVTKSFLEISSGPLTTEWEFDSE